MERVRDAVEDHVSVAWNIPTSNPRSTLSVRLENFEGPLDLLLHLIKKSEVNIYDIPIALITAQYLDTIRLMQELDLDVAGEYLVMAATLIHIKSKMLLPRPETAAGVEGDEEDPRDALVRRLLEHQKFKAAAGLLHEREQVRAAQWQRPDERIAGSPATTTSRSSKSICSACSPPFRRSCSARSSAEGAAASGTDTGGGADRAAAGAPVGNRGVRFRGLFADVSERERPDRHVSRPARDDSIEARARVPVGELWSDPRLQAAAPGGRAASDWRSGGTPWMTEHERWAEGGRGRAGTWPGGSA